MDIMSPYWFPALFYAVVGFDVGRMGCSMMKKKALVVGIDAYPSNPLSGCVSDATAMATLLGRNGDGSPNCWIRPLTSKHETVTTALLTDAIAELFKGDVDTAVLFFAGHGIINPVTNSGYIVTQNGSKGAWGISLSELLAQANRAYPRIKSTVIILDSCQSGFAGEVAGIGNDQLSLIGTGLRFLPRPNEMVARKKLTATVCSQA
jgi:hypothetical protein